jgi:hypothetical protein
VRSIRLHRRDRQPGRPSEESVPAAPSDTAAEPGLEGERLLVVEAYCDAYPGSHDERTRANDELRRTPPSGERLG